VGSGPLHWIVDFISLVVGGVGYLLVNVVYIPNSSWHSDNVLKRSDKYVHLLHVALIPTGLNFVITMSSWRQGWRKETKDGSFTGYT